MLGGSGGCVGCSGRDDVEGGALRGTWDTEGDGGVCRPGDSGTGGEGCVVGGWGNSTVSNTVVGARAGGGAGDDGRELRGADGGGGDGGGDDGSRGRRGGCALGVAHSTSVPEPADKSTPLIDSSSRVESSASGRAPSVASAEDTPANPPVHAPPAKVKEASITRPCASLLRCVSSLRCGEAAPEPNSSDDSGDADGGSMNVRTLSANVQGVLHGTMRRSASSKLAWWAALKASSVTEDQNCALVVAAGVAGARTEGGPCGDGGGGSTGASANAQLASAPFPAVTQVLAASRAR